MSCGAACFRALTTSAIYGTGMQQDTRPGVSALIRIKIAACIVKNTGVILYKVIYSDPTQKRLVTVFFIINLVRMFAWADSQDQSLH